MNPMGFRWVTGFITDFPLTSRKITNTKAKNSSSIEKIIAMKFDFLLDWKPKLT